MTLFALWILLPGTTCFAQSTVSLPLEGWYRTGRYLPVQVAADASSSTATIEADGAIRVDFNSSGRSSQIVPLLIVAGTADRLRINGTPTAGTPGFRPLASHQQLVAVAGGGDRLAKKLFPGESIVTIHVDPLNPLPGPALAWQTLDALILDGPWPGSFDIRKLPDLLAGGTEVAVASVDRPDQALPWESVEGGWVLRPAIAGPMGCDGNDEAYAPVGAWYPDRPPALRSQIVLAGVLFSLASIACLLLPKRFFMLSTTLATALTITAICAWTSHAPTTFRGQGDVIVHQQPLVQTDRWQFFTAHFATTSDCDCRSEMWPIFAEPAQAQSMHVALQWNGDNGRFTFSLPRDGKLAFVSRTLEPSSPMFNREGADDSDSPMAALARSLYARAKERQTTENGFRWNAADPSPLWPTADLWPLASQ